MQCKEAKKAKKEVGGARMTAESQRARPPVPRGKPSRTEILDALGGRGREAECPERLYNPQGDPSNWQHVLLRRVGPTGTYKHESIHRYIKS
eukprot:7279268-Pyramimonas_sp.AAC.1